MKRDARLERKQDTRQKIMMGGLIIKAGLSELHATNPEVILGILLEAKASLESSTPDLAKWKQLGLQEMVK